MIERGHAPKNWLSQNLPHGNSIKNGDISIDFGIEMKVVSVRFGVNACFSFHQCVECTSKEILKSFEKFRTPAHMQPDTVVKNNGRQGSKIWSIVSSVIFRDFACVILFVIV